MGFQVHLIDGTYELFRHYYALPSRLTRDGMEIAATLGVARSLLRLLDDGATHVAIATDHVVESFRNALWAGYKTGEGMDPLLYAQFRPLEDLLEALGFCVWRMIEHEADDGLAAGAHLASQDERVTQVLICTPDKDLAQCVEGDRVVQFDRMRRKLFDVDAVVEKFGVLPESIPDYLALVGDTADGYPGLPGWGAKSTSTVVKRYGHIEAIPGGADAWDIKVRGAVKLAQTLADDRELALLFRHIATVVRDAPVAQSVDELEWRGPTAGLVDLAAQLGAPELEAEVAEVLSRRGG